MFLVFMPGVVFDKGNYSRDISKYLLKGSQQKVVLSLWHVETFEGGNKSRKKYLEEVGMKFNKENQGVFVSVISLTKEQLFLNLQEGNFPDLFSFSIGCGEEVFSYLLELESNKNIRKELIKYGKVNNKIFAYPYMMSCFVAISKDDGSDKTLSEVMQEKQEKGKANFGFANKMETNFSKALIKNNIEGIDIKNYCEFDNSYDAYCGFVGGKIKTLIGTLRDVHRCKNRESLGTIGSLRYEVLGGYSDMEQYIGINKGVCEQKLEIAKDFLNFVCGKVGQKMICNYGLLSVGEESVYDDGYMKEIEKEMLKTEVESVDIFLKENGIEKEKEEAFDILFD